jgi:ribosomal-protein-alanine N-acetyltransferase
MHDSAAESIEPTRLRYVRLQKEHLAEVLVLEHDSYPDPWTQGMFHQEMRNGPSHFYLAFHDDLLVAYGGFWMILDEIHITKVTVGRPWRGQGLGRVFMAFLEARGEEAGGKVIRLEVRESNAAARGLYRNMGFEEIGIRKNYYAVSAEHAVVMVKYLASNQEESVP